MANWLGERWRAGRKNGHVNDGAARPSACSLQCRTTLSTFAKANVLGRSGSYVVQEPFLPPDANWLGGTCRAGGEKAPFMIKGLGRPLPVSQWRNWREGSGGIILPISFFVVDRQPQVLQGQNLLVGQLRSCGVGAGGKTLFAGGRLNSIWQITYLRSAAFGFACAPLAMDWKRCGEMSKRELFLFAEISIPKYNDNHCR